MSDITHNNGTHPVTKKSDKYIPYYIVLFFIVIGAVDAVFVSVALRTHTGVVTEGAYEKGLAYNDVLDQAAAQSKLHWTSNMSLTKNQSLFILQIHDKNKKLIPDAEGRLEIFRPTQDGYDFETSLTFNPETNRYEAPLKFPLKGQWEIRAHLWRGNDNYNRAKRFVIQ